MSNDEFHWCRIERFKGYGRLDAPIVFVGIEEGLDKPKDCPPDLLAALLDDDLRARSLYQSDLMDIEEAHRDLHNGQNLFSSTPRRQPTWRVMSDLMIAHDRLVYANADQRRNLRAWYRSKRLGRKDGDTLLMEILPYPHPKNTDWLYSRFDRFETRADYENVMLPKRLELLRGVIAMAPRKAIICYGKGARDEYGTFATWERYKLLFPKALWRDIGSLKIAELNDARVVLTDHFSTKSFNTDHQLDELARIVFDDLVPRITPP